MKCPNCDGKGFNIIYENNQSYAEDCNMCNGTGELRNGKTNRDKLMEMNNEEIAHIMDKDICKMCAYDSNNCLDLECEDGIKEWLGTYVED